MSELRFDVVGAEGPKRYFALLMKEQLAHGYCFTGPAGVGKKTFARRLAQSLLCLAPKDGVLGYDGDCSSCALFAREHTRHPDFLEHVGALRIGDADSPLGFHESEELSARDLIRQLSLQSYSGGMRVLLLGDADFATHEAANALLKLLEEPPSGLVIVVTTATPGRLLDTIRSRLIDVRFPLLSKDELAEILKGLGYGAKAVKLGVSVGGGSVRRAVAALAPEDESLRAVVIEWFFTVVAGKLPQESWATRESLGEGLEIVKMLVRDWIVANLDSNPLLCADQESRLRKLPALKGDAAAALLTKLDVAARLARTNVLPNFVADFVRMNLTSSR
ncbi:MAG: hypothetical protein JO078_12740 [Candidatus Eremiobacteraeota bacterium]|nr:hypothetical protein [Candidatus Eremiobacteraeota bacterium]